MYRSSPGKRRKRPNPSRLLATPGNLTAGHTNRQPHHRGGVACGHVAEEMYAKVNSAKANGEHQCYVHSNNGAWEWDPPSDDENVSEHSVGDQRTHCVTTGKAPAGLRQPRIVKHRPQAVKEGLEHRIQKPAARQGHHPPDQQQPASIDEQYKRNR